MTQNRFERREVVKHLYFVEKLSVFKICKQLNLDSRTVYNELEAIGGSPELQLEYPASDALQDSVMAVAGLAHSIRDMIERDIANLEPQARGAHFRELKTLVESYGTMYDRVFPMLDAYWKRTGERLELPQPGRLDSDAKLKSAEISAEMFATEGDEHESTD